MRFIKRAQVLGFTLSEIKEYGTSRTTPGFGTTPASS